MGTRTIIPGSNNAGQIGSESKYWDKGYFNTIHVNDLHTSSSSTLSINGMSVTGSSGIIFEGSSADEHELQLAATNPTADRIILFPDASGTIALTSGIPSTESIQDIVGAMFSGNTETNITATYQDGDGTIDLVSTDTNTTYTAGDGLNLSGTEFEAKLKANGGVVIETTRLAVDLGASSITGTLAVGDGGTGTSTGEKVSSGNFILKQTKVALNGTACNGLNATPQTLVAAAVPNTIIVPVDCVVLVDYNSAQSVNCDLIVGYNGTTAYQYAIRYVRRFMYGVSTDMTMHLVPYLGNAAASLTGGIDVPLTISTSAPISSGSLTSMTIYTSYYIIDNS